MNYPMLSKGQKIVINTGYSLIDAEVDSATETLVSPVGHKEFLRFDCYAVPDEMERLINETRLYADAVESLARSRMGQ